MNEYLPEHERELISALMDGQATQDETQRAMSLLQTSDAARADWHAYHLIGDALRMPGLRSRPQDEALQVQGIRASLQSEPIPLAPAALADAAPLQRRARPRHRLGAAVAAAVAGFAVVGSAYWLTRVDADESPALMAMSMALSGGSDLRRASVDGAPSNFSAGNPGTAQGAATAVASGGFREILRLPRGPAQRPQESVQVLYSNGSATISVLMEPHRPGEHHTHAEAGDRLNTLSLQRNGQWLTLSGDVPLGTLSQFASELPAR